jgi:hypothetical protein
VGARAWIESLAGDAQAAAVEADIRAELEAHLELAEEALRGEGRSPDEARREARERFGDFERTLRACRRERMGGRLMLVRIQWVLIALLTLSTLGLALYGRDRAAEMAMERERAMTQAATAQALLLDLERKQVPGEPVEEIVVRVGDELETFDRSRRFEFGTRTVVQKDGEALLPEIGWIDVAGKSRQEVEGVLTVAYRQIYPDIWVDVIVHQE